MFRKFFLLAPACAALLLGSCGEKSEAEKAEDERAGVREEKRKRAIEAYQTFAKEYPDHPKAAEARQKAAALEAMAPKK
jgi:hypothetical protein